MSISFLGSRPWLGRTAMRFSRCADRSTDELDAAQVHISALESVSVSTPGSIATSPFHQGPTTQHLADRVYCTLVVWTLVVVGHGGILSAPELPLSIAPDGDAANL